MNTNIIFLIILAVLFTFSVVYYIYFYRHVSKEWNKKHPDNPVKPDDFLLTLNLRKIIFRSTEEFKIERKVWFILGPLLIIIVVTLLILTSK